MKNVCFQYSINVSKNFGRLGFNALPGGWARETVSGLTYFGTGFGMYMWVADNAGTYKYASIYGREEYSGNGFTVGSITSNKDDYYYSVRCVQDFKTLRFEYGDY